MDESDVQQFECLLNAATPHWDAVKAHVAAGDYKRARHSLDRLHALLDADARLTLTLSPATEAD